MNRWLQDKEPVQVIDVRRAADYEKGHIPGAINLPQQRWDTYQGLQKGQCHLAATAAAKFAAEGYSVSELAGGFEAWKSYGLNVEAKRPVGVAP